ncbi:MAG TPA: TetR/AcrR family transcriptional regulator [Candidatus Mediterraneibacter merdavium]|nr:TetR/AcrR family transcriptional regulator [Candidatus Mediterraneibacter merdavium]
MKPSDISKDYLSKALLLLMEKKEYTAITVKDIAEKAGVSRLTFYRNFDSKEHILAWHIDQGFNEYLSTITNAPENDLRAAISLCFSFWEKRSAEIRLFIRHDMTYILQRPFETCMQTLTEHIGVLQNLPPMQRQFLIGGMFSDMLEWISKDCAFTPDEVTDEILSMFSEEFLKMKNPGT